MKLPSVVVLLLGAFCAGGIASAKNCRESNPVGVRNATRIPNNRIIATSTRTIGDKTYQPYNGRLFGSRFWSPIFEDDVNSYLQIDMGKAYTICAVATQGGNKCIPWWVTEYKLSYSSDKSTWQTYKQGENDKIFQGNSDIATVVKNQLPNPIIARYIRFIPISFRGWIAMRVEVYFVQKGPDCAPTMISVQAVSSTSIRVTWSPLRDSRQCRLNGALRGCKVAYRFNRYGSRWKYQDIRDSGRTTTVLSGLNKYTEYSFKVLAYTVKDGPWSREMITRTLEEDLD